MRTAPLLVATIAALPACLSSPDGKPQHWPPPDIGDDVEVAAIAAGAIDDDAIDDLVVVVIADGEGLAFLLRGGVDLQPGADAPITSFSRVAELGPIDPPVEALVVDHSVVVTYLADDAARLSLLDADLAVSAAHELPFALVGVTIDATLGVLPFGGDDRLFVSVGPQLRHVSLDELGDDDPTFVQLPAPDDVVSGWPPVRLVSASPTAPAIVVAGDIDAWVSPLPATAGPPQLDWTRLRQGSTQPWEPSIVIGTGLDAALIGRAPNAGEPDELCGVPLDASAAASCVELAPGNSQGRSALFAAPLRPPGALEVISVVSGESDTRIAIFSDVDLVGGQIQFAEDPILPLGPTDVTAGLAAIGDFGGDEAVELIVVGDDGDAACLSLGDPLLVACEP